MELIKSLSRSIGTRVLPLLIMIGVFYFFKDVSVETSLDALKNYLIFSLIVVVISVTLGAVIKTSSKKVKALVAKQKAIVNKTILTNQSKNETVKKKTSINFKIDLYIVTIVVLTGLFVTNIISLDNVVFALFALEAFLLLVVLFTSVVAFIGLSLTIKNLKRI